MEAVALPIGGAFWIVSAGSIAALSILYPAPSFTHVAPPALLLVLVTHTAVTIPKEQAWGLAVITTLIPLLPWVVFSNDQLPMFTKDNSQVWILIYSRYNFIT